MSKGVMYIISGIPTQEAMDLLDKRIRQALANAKDNKMSAFIAGEIPTSILRVYNNKADTISFSDYVQEVYLNGGSQ